MIRALPLDKLFVGVELIAIWTVPATVDGLVDITSCLRPAKEFLRSSNMPLLRSTNPVVVRDVQAGPRKSKSLIHFIDPGGRVDTVRLSSTHYMLAIFVNPHTEVGVVSLQAMKTRNNICSHFLQ